VKRLEVVTKTTRSSNEAMVADAGQTSATTLVTTNKTFSQIIQDSQQHKETAHQHRVTVKVATGILQRSDKNPRRVATRAQRVNRRM